MRRLSYGGFLIGLILSGHAIAQSDAPQKPQQVADSQELIYYGYPASSSNLDLSLNAKDGEILQVAYLQRVSRVYADFCKRFMAAFPDVNLALHTASPESLAVLSDLFLGAKNVPEGPTVAIGMYVVTLTMSMRVPSAYKLRIERFFQENTDFTFKPMIEGQGPSCRFTLAAAE